MSSTPAPKRPAVVPVAAPPTIVASPDRFPIALVSASARTGARRLHSCLFLLAASAPDDGSRFPRLGSSQRLEQHPAPGLHDGADGHRSALVLPHRSLWRLHPQHLAALRPAGQHCG